MTEHQIHTPEHLKPIQIQFGDVFTSNKNSDPNAKSLITRLVPELNYCEAAPLDLKSGKESASLHHGGMITRKDINQIVDHFGLRRVLHVLMVAYGDQEPVGGIYELIKEYSKTKLMKIV